MRESARRARVMATVIVAGSVVLGAAPALAATAAGPVNGTAPIKGAVPSYATAGSDAGSVPGSRRLTVRLYLGVRHRRQLDAFVRAVSDPGSRRHGRYLTPSQFARRFGPTRGELRAIERWLTAAHLHVDVASRHYVEVSGTAHDLDVAMHTTFHRYRTSWGIVQAPSSTPRAPGDVASSIVAVAARGAAGGAAPMSDSAGQPARGCASYFGQAPEPKGLPAVHGRVPKLVPCPYTPRQLRAAYGMSRGTADGAGRTVAIVDAYGSATIRADAGEFARSVGGRPLRHGQLLIHANPAGYRDTKACASPASWAGEQALDVEMAHAYAPGARIEYVGADSCLNSDLLDAEARIIDTRSADIISNSWAEIADSSRHYLTPGVVAAWNTLLEQAAAEGIGVYFASGDCGDQSPAAASTGLNCDPTTLHAQAAFPASSPWVTAVGGTALLVGRRGTYQGEVPMGDLVSVLTPDGSKWAPIPGVFVYGGGGGRSGFVRPWWQAGVPRDGGTPHRMVPDVAMQGDFALPVLIGYTISGRFTELGYAGTSVATPAFAAVQADAEQRSGTTIGFADPMLYRLHRRFPAAFHDIVQPHRPPLVVQNTGETGRLRDLLYTVGDDYGLPAARGWDPATGLGSPTHAYLELSGRRRIHRHGPRATGSRQAR